jgi:cell division septation protein DedD
VRIAPAPAPERVVQAQRVVPKHVYINRQNTQNVTVPKGYKPVWEDDRLNPRRAEQTLQGDAQMKLIWTKGTPRRLINQVNGEDMTAKLPLVYPYTNVATQTRKFGKVTLVRRDGKIMKRIQRNTARAKVDPKAARVSTRSTPKAAAAPKAKVAQPQAGYRAYVQIGMFGVPSNADRAASSLRAAGLPARTGKVTRGGKTYKIVYAGPFGDTANTNAALRIARAKGFSDAYVRK